MNQLYNAIRRQRTALTACFILCACFIGQAQPCLQPDTCDVTGNDPYLWNNNYFLDKNRRQHDLYEMPVDLQVRLDSICATSGLQIRYSLLLDLDNNGVTETVVHSDQPQLAGTIFFENAFQPGYQGGIPIAFDKRPATDPALDRYRFALQVTPNGTGIVAALRFNTLRDSNTFVLPQIPHGKHRMQWFIRDSCGREKTCDYVFETKDCEKPTVKCKNFVSVNMLQTGLVGIWAADLLDQASDNCTPPDRLLFAISKERPVKTSFPRDPLTKQPVVTLYFDCCDLGTHLITLWVEDEAGNFNSCATLVTINSHTRCSCSPKIGGSIKTAQNKGIQDAKIVVDGSIPYPSPRMYQTVVDSSGYFEFRTRTPTGGNVRICPQLNEHPLNGVTTLDLAQITKHILGLETFLSPYQQIAADVNASGTITTFDVVELRKLILGIYDTFPNNQSWRFVAKSHVFPNPAAPFSTPFPECAAYPQLYTDLYDLDFVGIKIGDVNYTARTNNLQNTMEERAVESDSIQTNTKKILRQ